MGEALWLLRVSDKGRAAAAGTIHDYIYPCPIDRGVMERWKVTPAEFEDALRRNPTDDQLYAWFAQRVAEPDIRAANAWLLQRTLREPRPSGRRRRGHGRATLMGTAIEYSRPDGGTTPGYFCPAPPPHGPGAAGVVVIPEWWGLDERIKATADRLASYGFNVLVPDLFRGRSAATGDEANHLMEGLDFGDAATQDVVGAARYLRDRGAKRVGVIGFCMGGALALIAAMNGRAFDAASLWYGYPPPEAGDPGTIGIPIQGHWATGDGFFTIAGVDALEQRLADAGVKHEFHRYDAQHGFYNTGEVGRGGLGHYHREHAETAWQRTVDFFDRTLRRAR